MVLIYQNSGNTVALTLSESTTLSATNVYYLFKFTSRDTKQSVLFTGQDISPAPIRYNLFNIIETGSTYVNLTASTLNLNPRGWWNYKIYQQLSQTNLSITGTTGTPIEFGKVLVTGSSLSIASTTFINTATTRVVFQN